MIIPKMVLGLETDDKGIPQLDLGLAKPVEEKQPAVTPKQKTQQATPMPKGSGWEAVKRMRGNNPTLLLLSSRESEGAISNLMRLSKDIANPTYTTPLAQFGELNAPYDKAAAYLLSDQVPIAKLQQDMASTKVSNFHTKIADDFFEKGSPFTEEIQAKINRSSDFGKNVNSVQGFMQALDAHWELLKKQGGEFPEQEGQEEFETLDAIPVLQMNGEIPLNYTRFLDPEGARKDYSYYIGGQPSNAGIEGFVYIIVTREEKNAFIGWMKAFKQPPLFYNQLIYLSDMDLPFKEYKPLHFTPPPTLIIDMAKPLPEPKQGSELLAVFHTIAKERLGNTSKPGAFLSGRRPYYGDLIVNFNRERNRAIIWGSKTAAPKVNTEELKKKYPWMENIILLP